MLEGLATGAIQGDPRDAAQFLASIAKLGDSVGGDCGVAEAFVIAEAALRALTEYNERTKAFLELPRIELQNMIAMTTRTIATMASGCETSIQRLQNVEQQIEKATNLSDVHQLKGQLIECLEQVRMETAQQQKARAAASEIQAELESSRQRMQAAGPQLDPVTGLPVGAAVNGVLRVCLKQDRHSYAVAFVVQRIQSINMRFGYDLGDQVLKAFAEHLKSALSGSDRLFRWRGPTIIAVLERAQAMERVRAEMKRIAETSTGRTFEINKREVLIAITANWTVVPVTDSTESIRAQIDTFVASQLPAMATGASPS